MKDNLNYLINKANSTESAEDIQAVMARLTDLMSERPNLYTLWYRTHTNYRKKLKQLYPDIYTAHYNDKPAIRTNEWTMQEMSQEKLKRHRESAKKAVSEYWAKYREEKSK